MRKLTSLILICLAFTELCSAQTIASEKAVRAKQDSIFEILFTDTKGAKKAIDELLTSSTRLSDTTKALNYNLLGIYLNVTGQLDSSIVIFKKGYELNGDHAYRKPKFISNLGTSYRNAGKYNQSLSYFEELNNYYLQRGDTLGHAKAIGEMAAVYNLTLQHEKAVRDLTKAIEIWKRYDGEVSEHGVLLQRLANTYMKQRKFEFAIDIYEQSLEKFKESKRMDNYYLTLINVADCYQYLEEYEKGLTIINEGLEGLKQYGNSGLLAVGYGVKADLLKHLKKYKASLSAYEEGIAHAYKISSNRTVQIAREFLELLIILENHSRAEQLVYETDLYFNDANIEYQYSYLEVVAEFKVAQNKYKEAVSLLQEAHTLKDSSYYDNKEQLVDDIQALYRIQERETENKELNDTIVEMKEEMSLLTVGFIILMIMIIFIIVIWVTRANYQKRMISLKKYQNEDLQRKLEIEKEYAQLKERLIEQQKTELLGYSMEVANMNEKIDALIKTSDIDDDNSELGQQLKSMITVNKSWESFINRFKEVEPDFIPRLSRSYPNLTQKDLEFCSLVRINVSYKDIANFLQISHESVFKKRYRIAQKMDLEKGTDFQQFIIQF